MSLNSQLVLKLEDGTPIWFALHERVTNRPVLAQLIQTHHGSVVDSSVEADFCLISAYRPDATEAAARVNEEGGNAIDASWIWESNTLGRLLPWYPYQLGKINKNPDMSDEMRDIHELATSLARYLPFAPSVDSIYTHLAMRLPHRKAIQFKQLHEERQPAVDACVFHLANQIDNITPPTGYLLASSTSAGLTPSSLPSGSVIPETNQVRTKNNNPGRPPKNSSFLSVAPAEPLSNSANAGGGEADLTPVQFPIEEQDAETGTRVSAEPPLSRVTTIPNTTPRPNNVAPAPTNSTQHDSETTTQNSRPRESSGAQAKGSIQSPNENRIPPHDGVVTATATATKEKPGLPQKFVGTTVVSETQLKASQRRSRAPVPHLLDAMEQEETEDEDEDKSYGGEYVLPARIRRRDGNDSDEEERPKRRRKKNNGSEKVRENGERRSRGPPVPQHQIDAMIQWGLNHPIEKGVNQKVYWSKFVEESNIGKERTWASWDAISRRYGRPPMMGEPAGIQPSPIVAIPAVEPHPQAITNPPFRPVIPPAPGNKKPAEIKTSDTPQTKSTVSNRPLPDNEGSKQLYPEAPSKRSHIVAIKGPVTCPPASTSNGTGSQPHTGATQEQASFVGTNGVKTTPPASSKPPVDGRRLVFPFKRFTHGKEPTRTSNTVPSLTGPWPYGLQAVGDAPSEVFRGFPHSIRDPSKFQSRVWDKEPSPTRPTQ